MEIRTFSNYCKEKFGTKVYRLSLSTGCSCPNRDGKVGFGGCTFCSEDGSGEFAAKNKEIDEQIQIAKKLVEKKFPKKIKESNKKYIAYFQSFTNTYGEVKELKKIFEDAGKREEIVAVSIATRPDCLEDEMIEMLAEVNRIKPIWIELGLQTIHEDCAEKFNRGYKLDVFIMSYKKLREKGIEVIVHVILGLPYETKEESLKTIKFLSELNPKLEGIKIHLLQVLKGTKIGREYEKNPFPIMSLEEYTSLLIESLKILPEETVIHRLTGDGDKRNLIEPLWCADKKKVLNYINKMIKEAKR